MEGPLVLTESKGPSQCVQTEKYWQSGWKGHQLLAWRYRKTWKEKSKICFLEHQQRSAKQRLCQNRSGRVGVYVGLGSHGESRAPGPIDSFPRAQNHHIIQHPSADTCSVLQRHGCLVSMHKMATSECQSLCKHYCSFCCRWRDICDALGQVCCAAFVFCISQTSTVHMVSRLCHRSWCCSLLFLIIT